jgi:1,4-dihydroxy-2-naphthoyl-CoA synthase
LQNLAISFLRFPFLAKHDAVAASPRLTFDRPQARNALTFAMYEQMAAICATVNAGRSIKAMILSGIGDKAFASGTDILQFRAFKTAQGALDYEARIDRMLGALEAVRVPTIAAIFGACTGAARASPPAAISGSALRRRGSAFRSRGRSAIACRCPTSAGSFR